MFSNVLDTVVSGCFFQKYSPLDIIQTCGLVNDNAGGDERIRDTKKRQAELCKITL